MAKFIDLTGKRFGYLVAMEPIRADGRIKWKCICDCGKIVITTGSHLTCGHTQSCGCLQRKRASESTLKDLSGLRFGRLVAVERVGDIGTRARYRCICDCGKEIVVEASNLRTGATKSCGCIRKEIARKLKLSHGKYGSRIYRCWTNMKDRCGNPRNKEFGNYGERGIFVCKEWNDFNVFYHWAVSSGYQPELTIERIDVNGGYSPSNCTWADMNTQSRNRTDNVRLSFRGKTMILEDWAKETGISASTIRHRLKRGWPVEQVLTTKPNGAEPKP